MNSKMKSLMLPYMMLASGALNPEIDAFNSMERTKTISKPEWERKKCKSCNNFHKTYCSIKAYVKPLDAACDKYEKRK